MSKKGTGKFVVGALIGAGLGILLAPEKGEVTRKQLKKKMDDLINKAKNIDYNDVKDSIEKKIKELQKEVEDLDKEKVLKIAKQKGQDIIKKADELVKLALEKGTPVVQKAAEDVRLKTIDVLEATIDKLEKSDTKTKK